MTDVFVSGRYDGECPGWIYDKERKGYLKEHFNSRFNSLGKSVEKGGIYQVNGLFSRFEVVRSLTEEIHSAHFFANQPSGVHVFESMTPNAESRCCRNKLKIETIQKYLRIDRTMKNASGIEFGNFKYCEGMGERLWGDGLYVKYLKAADFEILSSVHSDLKEHYKLRETLASEPPGYYYHDLGDSEFTKQYKCVHVVSKSDQIKDAMFYHDHGDDG